MTTGIRDISFFDLSHTARTHSELNCGRDISNTVSCVESEVRIVHVHARTSNMQTFDMDDIGKGTTGMDPDADVKMFAKIVNVAFKNSYVRDSRLLLPPSGNGDRNRISLHQNDVTSNEAKKNLIPSFLE